MNTSGWDQEDHLPRGHEARVESGSGATSS